MSRTSRNIILIAVLVLLTGGLIVYSVLNNSARLPEDAIGNTAGNLNNTGLFAESDGTVYFANPYDNGCLYSMNEDQSNIKKLSELSAKYINAAGDYVFFSGTNNDTTTGFSTIITKPSLVMLSSDGKKEKILSNEVTQVMLLVGNRLYYQHYTESTGTTFAMIDVNKHKSTELLDYMINPASFYNGKFYFNGMYSDHYLYTYDTDTNEVGTVWEGDIWYPAFDGEYVYYMDVKNNYRLCRYSPERNEIEILETERLDSFNLYGDMIYYQVSSSKNPRLMRMNKDGSNQETVAEGVFKDINITRDYVYFSEFGTDYPLYSTPTTGSIDVREFYAY